MNWMCVTEAAKLAAGMINITRQLIKKGVVEQSLQNPLTTIGIAKTAAKLDWFKCNQLQAAVAVVVGLTKTRLRIIIGLQFLLVYVNLDGVIALSS